MSYKLHSAARILPVIAPFSLLLLGLAAWRLTVVPRPKVEWAVTMLPADGQEHSVATLNMRHGLSLRADLQVHGAPVSTVHLRGLDGGRVLLLLRTPVQPGRLRLTVSDAGGAIALPLTLLPDDTDSFGDGTPDWMHLHAETDREAFRRWFTELAERAADASPDQLPPEITDCASLLRYAYREALVAHDDRWYAQFPVEQMPPLASVQQWTFPNTLLGTGLFRTRPGPFVSTDRTDGTFAQFADAKTLLADNAYFIGRDIRSGRPGDLIFYRLLERDSQYHSMIVTGEQGEWVVYHTGPIDKHRGEMRRVLLADLLRHPDPRWRPVPANPNFLGVYRWNILR
jgi:hypothetical protein